MNDRKRKGPAASSAMSSTSAEQAANGKRQRLQRPSGSTEESTVVSSVENSGLDYGNADGSQTGSFVEATPSVFAKRSANLFVPMIPLDMLPHSITIWGLRTKYTFEEVEHFGGHMIFGQDEPGTWKIEIDGTKVKVESDDDRDGNDSLHVPSHKSINDRLSAVFGSRPSTHGPSVAPAPTPRRQPTAAQTTTQRYNPTTPGVLGQKVYCTHWMRTGECDFTQQGCMFLHCMPDLDTLEKLGFRAYPRWFREMPRQFQEENSKEFSADGLNPQRVQIREMSQTPMPSHSMPPPPPPASASGNGHRNSNPYSSRGTSSMYDGRSQFPQFQPYSSFSPGAAPYESHGSVPPYGHEYAQSYREASHERESRQSTSQRSRSGHESSSRKRTAHDEGSQSNAPSSSRSLLSRDNSPTPSHDGLRSYASLTPSADTPDPAPKGNDANIESKHRTYEEPAYSHKKRFRNTPRVTEAPTMANDFQTLDDGSRRSAASRSGSQCGDKDVVMAEQTRDEGEIAEH